MGKCLDWYNEINCKYHDRKVYDDGPGCVDVICECAHPIAKAEYHSKSCVNEIWDGKTEDCPYFESNDG